MERNELIKVAEAKGIKVNKFWSTKKVFGSIQSDKMIRAWETRRSVFPSSGVSPQSRSRRNWGPEQLRFN